MAFLGRFGHAHYVVNVLLLMSYGVARVKYTSEKLTERESWLGLTREHQVLLVLVGFVVFNYRKKATVDGVIAMVFLYSKGAIAGLFYLLDTTLFACFVVAALAIFLGVPYPKYVGPHKYTTLTASFFNQHVRGNGGSGQWLVYLHADWCDECLYHDAMFAALSLAYALSFQLDPTLACLTQHKSPITKTSSWINLGLWTSSDLTHGTDVVRFGRLDVDTHPEIAHELNIDTNATTTKQLPSLVLFDRGVEVKRLPRFDHTGAVVRTILDLHGVAVYFGFEGLPQKKTK